MATIILSSLDPKRIQEALGGGYLGSRPGPSGVSQRDPGQRLPRPGLPAAAGADPGRWPGAPRRSCKSAGIGGLLPCAKPTSSRPPSGCTMWRLAPTWPSRLPTASTYGAWVATCPG